MHALYSGVDVRSYAKIAGRKENTVGDEVKAARVAAAVTDIRDDLSQRFSQLVAIHAARSWLWGALVAAMLSESTSAAIPKID